MKNPNQNKNHMQSDELSRSSWMAGDIKNEIVKERNIDGLFSLTDNSDFSIALYEILNNRCEDDPKILNHSQRVLFLCMHIENSGQADSILGFLQEDYPAYNIEAVNALKEIGAMKSAEIIEQAIDLLPEDGEWFFDNADDASICLMDKLDSQFSNYPDGLLRDLYRKYAEEHRSDFY